MTPRAATPTRWRSGWCGTGHHDDCRGAYAGAACGCWCHDKAPVVLTATEAIELAVDLAARAATPPAEDAPPARVSCSCGAETYPDPDAAPTARDWAHLVALLDEADSARREARARLDAVRALCTHPTGGTWPTVPTRKILAVLEGRCPTCSPPVRETVGMVCQTCGTDYGTEKAHRD